MTFELFSQYNPSRPAHDAGRDFYELLQEMRRAAHEGSLPGSGYPAFQEYAAICHWAIRKMEYGFVTRQFAELESAGTPLQVLDVGCGVVPLCNWISRRGHQVTALEPIEEDIRFLESSGMNGFYKSRVNYVHGRCEQLPFAASTFDVVTCVSVLEHMVPGNDRVALWEMARVLKPGGCLIMTFDVAPRRAPWESEGAWPAGRRRYAEPFEPDSLRCLLHHLVPWFIVATDDVPASFGQLDWTAVHDFWAASQTHDGRTTPHREYLAMGVVLTRIHAPIPSDPSQIFAAFLEGQDALAERVACYQKVAASRRDVIDGLHQSVIAHQKLLMQYRREASHVEPAQALERGAPR